MQPKSAIVIESERTILRGAKESAGEFELSFVPDASAPTAEVSDCAKAVARAQELEPGISAGVCQAGNGFALFFYPVRSSQAERFLENLASILEESGLAGTLRAASGEGSNRRLYERTPTYSAVAVATGAVVKLGEPPEYTPRSPGVRWVTGSQAFGNLVKYALDWARSVGDGRYLLGAAMYTEFCREDQVESFVAMACETVGWAKLEVTSAAGRRFQVVFGLDGYLLLHATAGDLLWRNGVQELTEQLERFAPVLDYAAVCRSDYGTLSLNDTLFFGGRRPEWLGGDPSSTHFVFKTYVPDILGVQLLGSGHDQLGPQDEWDVKFLEGGKRIESARDLELWFAQDDGPAGEVAERARSSNMNAVYTFQRWYEREMLIASKH